MMAKLKALPKALIVGGVIAVAAYGAMKFMPARTPDVAASAPVPGAAATQAVVVPNAAVPIVVSPPATPLTPSAPLPPPASEAALVAGPDGKFPGAGIASGSKTGTYYPMVQNIVDACSTPGYPLHNVVTNGTVDNILKVYTDKNSQFGIAQEDALEAQSKIDPKMMSRVVAVFPFYSEEIHLIAKEGSSINSLADLAGKRVVEGPDGSGTSVTAKLIRQVTGIQWQATSGNLSQKDGLEAVKNGQADAEFFVGGQPLNLLSTATGIKLVPLKSDALEKFGYYTPTQLPTGAYPWQSVTVPTYKVNNVIVTFAYKNQYQTEISNLVTCITKNLDKLQANGHPKWRDVDPLDITRVKWPVHPAALAAIKREAKPK
jgi:TRAP transporter TAXI family solute receptor